MRLRKNEWLLGCVANRPDAEALNKRLRMMMNKAGDEVTRCMEKNIPVDVSAIRRIIIGEKAPTSASETEVIDWIEKQLPEINMRYDTRKHYNTLVTRLMEFQGIRRWSDVTTENLYKFDAWLHQLDGKNGKKISDSGVFTYHKCLKAMLNRADRFGIIERNPYERMRGQLKRGDRMTVDYLTEEEMAAFMKLKPEPGTIMEKAKDLFVFQMFTGLAYSDAMAFDISNYRNVDGKWRAVGERVKTGVAYISDLMPQAVAVLEKYGWQVPRIGNADYNHELKGLGMAAGIPTPLHSHMARHTFATLMLNNGAKIENVSRMLGHTNVTQTQRYAKVLARSVHEDFEKVTMKLSEKKNQKAGD